MVCIVLYIGQLERLLADRDPLIYCAVAAGYVAAPVELAVTPVDQTPPDDVVPSPAAERRAPVHTPPSLLADPPRGPSCFEPWYWLTKAWRLLIIQEAASQVPWAFPPLFLLLPSSPDSQTSTSFIGFLHHYRLSEPLLQRYSYRPKIRCGSPTCSKLTASRYTMALTFHLHFLSYCLKQIISMIET